MQVFKLQRAVLFALGGGRILIYPVLSFIHVPFRYPRLSLFFLLTIDVKVVVPHS